MFDPTSPRYVRAADTERSGASAEIRRRLAGGAQPITIREMERRARALGYRIDRSCESTCTATDLTSGDRFPSRCLGSPIQIDDGLRAWNHKARRDKNFAAFQKLRMEVFAFDGTHVVDLC